MGATRALVTVRVGSNSIWINDAAQASSFLDVLAIQISALPPTTASVEVPVSVADNAAVVGHALEAQRLLGTVTSQQHHDLGAAIKAANRLRKLSNLAKHPRSAPRWPPGVWSDSGSADAQTDAAQLFDIAAHDASDDDASFCPEKPAEEPKVEEMPVIEPLATEPKAEEQPVEAGNAKETPVADLKAAETFVKESMADKTSAAEPTVMEAYTRGQRASQPDLHVDTTSAPLLLLDPMERTKTMDLLEKFVNF